MIEIEGFEFLERLGTGGMSTVWKARQRSLDREVAIKVLSPHFAATPEDVARFKAEARTAGRLNHPGIVQVYDAVFKDGVYCFVMELVNGYTVGDWVRRKGRLEERQALDIADSVAEALEHAWGLFGMVHCDIKPDNVMVDVDGTVKLTDLGLSRTVSALHSGTPLEEAEDVFGTPAYIAPEQAMGESRLDCRADMYSLGAMLYHLVSGTMLFGEESPEKVMELQVSAYVPALRTIVPAISIPFENLVEKLLAKDRRYRHANWGQVRRDIRAVRFRRPLPCGLPHPKASTMLPDPTRPVMASGNHRILRREPPPPQSRAKALLTTVSILAAGLLLLVGIHSASSVRSSRVRGTLSASRAAEARATALLEQAERWAESHPDQDAEIIARYQWVIDAVPLSTEAERARAVISLYRERLRKNEALKGRR